jgi:hypothetical protein
MSSKQLFVLLMCHTIHTWVGCCLLFHTRSHAAALQQLPAWLLPMLLL